jgi:hypothetical protein
MADGVRNVHRITPEWLAGVVTYYEKHGLAKTAAHYSVAESQARRYLVRAQSEGLYAGEIPQAVSHPKTARSSNGRADSIGVGRKLGQYLDEVAAGRSGSDAVALGQIPGVPAWTKDPETVRTAAAWLRERVTKEQGVKRLRTLQRVRDLEYAAELLEEEPEGDSLEAYFIANARAYAEANGIEYATFREVGVTAKVLREAGITR